MTALLTVTDDHQEVISPVSGSTVSAGEASSLGGSGSFRRRLFDCFSR
jgi:hypothetical protein